VFFVGMGRAVARRPAQQDVVQLPPIRREAGDARPTRASPAQATRPRGGLALAQQRPAVRADAARARALQMDLKMDARSARPASPVAPTSSPAGKKQVRKPPSQQQQARKQSPAQPSQARKPSPARKQTPQGKKQTPPPRKHPASPPQPLLELLPLGSPKAFPQGATSTPKARPLAERPPSPLAGTSPRSKPRTQKAHAPSSAGATPPTTLPPPATPPAASPSSRGCRAAASTPKGGRVSGGSSSRGSASGRGRRQLPPRSPRSQAASETAMSAMPSARPPPPPLSLPAAPQPEFAAQTPTNDLASLFWNSVHSALAPAAMDDQWAAVRRLLVTAS
jgi:hypothetical protein